MATYRNELAEPVTGLVPTLRQINRLNPEPLDSGATWMEHRKVSMQGGACGEGEIIDPCDAITAKTIRASEPPVENSTHVLQDSYSCASDKGPVGLTFADIQRDAVNNMERSTTALFERMFYNDYLAACVPANLGTPVGLLEGLSLLLADASVAGLRRIMLHVPSSLFPLASAADIAERVGNSFRLLNHLIVFGDGYPQPAGGNTNIYATSMPYGFLGDTYLLGENMRDVFDRQNNQVVAITERPAAVLMDDCFIGCYQVRTTGYDCDCSGTAPEAMPLTADRTTTRTDNTVITADRITVP